MQLHFDLLVICSIIVLGLLDYGDAYNCSRRYTCYRLQKSKSTHYKSCGWWLWRRRCQRHVTYYQKKIKSTCHRTSKVNGGWSSWSSWNKYGSCSASCRKCGSSSYPQQKYYKRRSCNNPTPRCGGSSCSGSPTQYTYFKCNTHYCRIDGGWGSWTSWGTGNRCTANCRTEGSSEPTLTRSRSRKCNNPSPRCNGKSCSGSSLQSNRQTCNTQYCPVNGEWSSWSSWSKYGSCSASCRKCGSSSYPQQKYYKRRSCNNPTPRYGGRSCSGSLTQYKYVKCNTHYCKSNGGWGSWTSWGKWNSCSDDCRKEGSSAPTQTRSRSRMCNNPSPRCNGKLCSGSGLQYDNQTCNTHCCRVDGGWGSWTSWGTGNRCSADCRTEGSSGPTLTRSRSRKCNNPSPRCNGKSCSGSSLQSNRQTCNTQYCPVDGGWKTFGLWSDWSDCSKSCDGGSRRRTRKRSCTNPIPKYGGKNCAGSDSETVVETCNTFTCPNFCTCDGSGYPHYYTPDGAFIHFMGTCKYTLWNSTIPNDRCEFRVETKNERRYGNNNVSWTRFIDFYIKNIKIRILKGGTTLINGIQVSLPIKIGSSNIEISRSGSYVTAVSSECNIRVQFDGNQLVSVKVPRDYFGGKLAGICGNCNGNYSDDLQTKDDKDVSSSGTRGHSDIGNSYKVFDDEKELDSSCDDASPIVNIPEDDREKSEKVCEYLVSDSIPFKACRESNKLNFTKMYESCEYDVAVSTLDDAHCPTLQSTALACSRHGFPVHWRTSNFCPLACDGDFVYKTSVSCTNTCDKPKADQNCLDPPVDGCTCPDKTYLSGDRCVAIDKCGSCDLIVGQFSTNLAVGDVSPKGDCRNAQRCDLVSGTFKLVTVPATKKCSGGEWCILNGLGEYNCAKKPGGTGSSNTPTTPGSNVTAKTPASDVTSTTSASNVTPTTPASDVTTTIPGSEVTTTTHASEVIPTTPASDVTTATPASEVTPTTRASEVTTTTLASDVTTATSASEVTSATPASNVTPTTPASDVTTATPASEVTSTTPASEVTPATPVSDVTSTTPASDVTPTTPASEVTSSTPASNVTPTTPASDVTPTTPASDVTPTTPASDVTTTTPASEVTSATRASDVTPTTPASDVTTATPASEITPTTPASEVTPTTRASEVTPATPASDVHSTTRASDVTPTTPASDVTTATPASDITSTTPGSDVTPITPGSNITSTTPASDVTPTTPGSEVTPKTPASEVTPKTSASDVPTTAPASEITPTTPASDVPTTAPASEVTPITPNTTPASSTAIETTTTTAASPVTPTTHNATPAPTKATGYKCKGMWEYYPDPDNCKGFILCNLGKPIKMSCGKGTIWSHKILTCIHGTC